MGLFFRSEVQVGVAVLVENSLDRVADDVIFSSVYFGEDITQGLQIFGHDTCSVMGDTVIPARSKESCSPLWWSPEDLLLNSFPEVTSKTTPFTAKYTSVSSFLP